MVGEFGRFSGLVINWEKSVFMPVDPLGDQIPAGTPQLKVGAMLIYLSIWITRDTNQYINNNLVPFLIKFKQKSDIWGRLRLSVAGLCNLIISATQLPGLDRSKMV